MQVVIGMVKALVLQVYVGCPDWTGSAKNWHPVQDVTRHDYRLTAADELELTGSSNVQLRLFNKPCAFGGMRYAISAMLQNGDRMVAKRILKEGSNLQRNQRVLEVCLPASRSSCSLQKAADASCALQLSVHLCAACILPAVYMSCSEGPIGVIS